MFDKNMDFIDNVELKRRLASMSPIETRMGISYCVSPTNDYVILKDEMPIDDLSDPRGAVVKHLTTNIKQEMKSTDTIIVFGIGLCYLLDEVFSRYSSRIYVYEPDIHLLHFVLNNVDISQHLSSGRIFITNELDELINKLGSTYLSQDKVEVVYLQNYAITKNKELMIMTQKVFETCKTKMVDVNTIMKFSEQWLVNTLENIAFINNNNNTYLLSDLESKFAGQTALIAAAGPSLSENVQKIKEDRSKIVVFAVNKAVKYLHDNGIIPDFVVYLDAKNVYSTIATLGNSISEMNCIMDIRADSNLFRMPFKNYYVSFPDSDFLVKKIAKYNPKFKFYECGGTAATFALVSAIKMGFSKIIFAGLDLAFKDNVIYSSGEKMNRTSQTEIMVNDVKKNLIQIRSVKGDMVYTRDDYEAYIQHFSTILKDTNFTEVYNTTSFGANIPRMKNVSFDEIGLYNQASLSQLGMLEPFNIEFKNYIQEEFHTINTIISMLSKGVFSSMLLSNITKSSLIYEYMQADVLKVLQRNFDPELASDFINKTKTSIKFVVELLQKLKLI